MPSNDDIALRLERVSKRYYLNPKRPWRMRDAFVRPRTFLRQIMPREPFWALRDVSLTVKRGEILGVIGRNGSGKSTLLRVLVGISPPTTGQVTMNGRYAALLDLGAGFHPNATGRENAYLNALFMGLTKAEAKARVPEIIEFSGLGEFADLPMKTYSTGMGMRLGFSVAVHVRPDILLIDEVLAVGDAEFQKKCLDHFTMLSEQKTTIVLVSHNLETLHEFAHRIIRLENGTVIQDGDPDQVIHDYLTQKMEESPAFLRTFERTLAERWGAEAVGASKGGRTEGP